MPARPMNFDKQDINILAVNNVDRIPGLMVRHDLNELNAEGGLEETLNMVPVYTTILPAGTCASRRWESAPHPAEEHPCVRTHQSHSRLPESSDPSVWD